VSPVKAYWLVCMYEILLSQQKRVSLAKALEGAGFLVGDNYRLTEEGTFLSCPTKGVGSIFVAEPGENFPTDNGPKDIRYVPVGFLGHTSVRVSNDERIPLKYISRLLSVLNGY